MQIRRDQTLHTPDNPEVMAALCCGWCRSQARWCAHAACPLGCAALLWWGVRCAAEPSLWHGVGSLGFPVLSAEYLCEMNEVVRVAEALTSSRKRGQQPSNHRAPSVGSLFRSCLAVDSSFVRTEECNDVSQCSHLHRYRPAAYVT